MGDETPCCKGDMNYESCHRTDMNVNNEQYM